MEIGANYVQWKTFKGDDVTIFAKLKIKKECADNNDDPWLGDRRRRQPNALSSSYGRTSNEKEQNFFSWPFIFSFDYCPMLDGRGSKP